ncbi:MAG: MazG family protein [Chlamydiales bacterium]|nr:MazG family protein [Chlamydiales bacterium]
MNQKAATQFQKLLDVADILLGENGCPWDQKQTYETLRRSLLEEAHEVLDAIDRKDIPNLTEELGDLLYNIIFLAKIGEKQKEFALDEVCELIRDKLISRHPHIFGDVKVHDAEEVVKLWEEVKSQEKKKDHGVPKGLPALARATQVAKKKKKKEEPTFKTEEELGEKLWSLVLQARAHGFDAESTLREKVIQEEHASPS